MRNYLLSYFNWIEGHFLSVSGIYLFYRKAEFSMCKNSVVYTALFIYNIHTVTFYSLLVLSE